MEVNARLLVLISVILTSIYVDYSQTTGKCGLMGIDRIIHINLLSLTLFLMININISRFL